MSEHAGEPEPDPERAGPWARRFSRLRWPMLACALATLAGLWVIWAWIARHRLQARIDSIVARHEPLFPRDFVRPLPDERNAAFYLLAAAKAVHAADEGPGNSGRNATYPPYSPTWLRLADQAVKSDQEALDFARKARDFDQADWGNRPGTPVGPSVDFGPLHIADFVATLLADAALDAHIHGDDAAAVEYIRDELHVAQAAHQFGYMTGYLTADEIETRGITMLQIMAPDFQVDNGRLELTASTQPIRPASRPAVIALIRELLDEQSHLRQRQFAAMSERMLQFDGARWIAHHSTILRPLCQLDAVRILDKADDDLRVLDQPADQSASSILVQERDGPPVISFAAQTVPSPRYSRVISFSLSRPWNWVVRDLWQGTAERRMAAVSLAVQLYRADHHQWPPSLDALVPTYLQAIPRNPLGAGDSPIGYVILRGVLSDGKDRPMLYADAVNPPDNHPPRPLPIFSDGPKGNRYWLDLSRWIPVRTATNPDPQ